MYADQVEKMTPSSPSPRPRSHWKEYGTAFCATLITATAGTCYGWPSPTMPQLHRGDSDITATEDQTSWITSIMILCSAISPIPSAYFADRYGRKTALLLGAVPFILGWVLVIVAKSVEVLYVARMFSGLGYGIVYTVAPMYTGEIATNEVRGALSTLITAMNKIGILTQYCIGPFVSVKTLASINLILPITFMLTFVFLPESPYYYLKQEDHSRAERSLRRLRTGELRNELKNIEITVQEDMRSKGSWKDLVTEATNRKALWLIFGIFAVQQLCGSAAVVSNVQVIFKKSEGVFKDYEESIIFGCVQVIAACLSVVLVDRLGRKPLLLVSSLGVAFANAVMGTFFYLKEQDEALVAGVKWLPLLTLIIYIISYAIGLSTVPYVIVSEIFPTNIKSYASCLAHIYTGISMFAVQKLSMVVGHLIGFHYVFYGFCACSSIGLFFILIALPETKGRSFASIQIQLKRKVALERPSMLKDTSIDT